VSTSCDRKQAAERCGTLSTITTQDKGVHGKDATGCCRLVTDLLWTLQQDAWPIPELPSIQTFPCCRTNDLMQCPCNCEACRRALNMHSKKLTRQTAKQTGSPSTGVVMLQQRAATTMSAHSFSALDNTQGQPSQEQSQQQARRSLVQNNATFQDCSNVLIHEAGG
jgi:hypothetical protein